MDLSEALKTMGIYISSGAIGAYVRKQGGYAGNIELDYYKSSQILEPIADYYTNRLVEEIPQLKYRPLWILNIGIFFERMAFAKRRCRFDDQFMEDAYEYARSVIKDNKLHGEGHNHFDRLINRIINKLSGSLGAISHFLRTVKNDFYYEHAKQYVPDVELKNTASHASQSTIHIVNGDDDISGSGYRDSTSSDVRGASKKSETGFSKKLKKIGIGGAILGLVGLAAYGAYRLKKERDKKKIEIGSRRKKTTSDDQ